MTEFDFTPYYQLVSPQWQLQNQLARDAMAQRQARMNALAPGLKGQEQINQYQQLLAQKELQAQSQAQQQAQLKALSEAGQSLRSLTGAFGRDFVVKNWDAFKGLHPLFKDVDPHNITHEGGYTQRDEQGNVIGTWAISPEGKAQFVRAPQSTALTMEQLTQRSLEEKLGRKPSATEILEQLQGAKGERNLTTEQLTARALEEKLQRKPTATEIKNQLQADKLEQMKANRAIIKQYGASGGQAAVAAQVPQFDQWSPEEKKWWYDNTIETGQRPSFGMGYAAAKNRAQYDRGLAQYARSKGLTGVAAATEKEAFKSNARALADLTKREQLIKSFTTRIDANIKLFESHRKDFANRYPRLVNIPLNKARQLMGSGDWAALNALMQSISSEVAKVETGSLGIAGVAEGAREVWDKIHDPNLSYNELMKVLDMSRELGQTASRAMAEQKAGLRQAMKTGGRQAMGSAPGPSNDPLGIRKGSSPKQTRGLADPLGIRK